MEVVKPLGEHELFLFFAQFAVLLIVARLLGELASRMRLPSVVGELMAGFLLGPTLLGSVAPGLFESLFPRQPEQVHLLEVVSWLGVVMLLVLTGLETDLPLITRKAKRAAAISLGGIVVPFATGVALGLVLPDDFLAAPDKPLVFALFIGTAMSISAIPVIAKVLMEMKIIRRDIGQMTLAAGMIDDTVGWILLSVVAGLAASGETSPLTAGRSVVAVLAVLVIAYTVGRRSVALLFRTLDDRVGGDTVMITTLVALALVFATITHALKLEVALGAFIAGVLVGQVKRFDHRLRHIFEQTTLGVFAPVFFAASGLRVDLGKLAQPRVLAVGLVVLAVAILGKFLGAYLGARATRLGNWEALSLGAGMNARGAMEIIVATIGLSRGILTPEMYSIILMVAIVTSVMAPPMLRWTLSHVEPSEEERERLETEARRRESFVANLKRVLLPVAGNGESTVASKVVGLVLEEEDVDVTSLHLDGDGGGRGGLGRGKDDGGTDAEHARDVIEAHVDDVRRRGRPEGDTVADAVLNEARRGYDLLVLPSVRRETAGQHSPFDSFVDRVVQDAPCPVLVVASPDDDAHAERVERLPGNRILVPVTGSSADRPAAEVACSMAAGHDTVVDVIHVVSPSQHQVRVSGDPVAQAVEIGEHLVAPIAGLARAMGARVETEVVVDDHPEQAIVARAERDTAVIVLSASRRPVTERAFFGHRIDYVVAHASCPVVVVSGP